MSKMSEKAAKEMEYEAHRDRIKKEYKSEKSYTIDTNGNEVLETKKDTKKSDLQIHIYAGGIKRYVCEEPFWSRCIPYILIAIVITIMACAIASEIMKVFK